MGFQAVNKYNDETIFGSFNNQKVVLKKALPIEMPMYNKLVGINCPNLPRFFGYQEYLGEMYAMLEYVDGESLEDYMERGGLVDEKLTKAVAVALCRALDVLHNNGIVHRDISPKNVILGSDGVIRLIDFGISRLIKENKARDTQILGTQGYAAPEQFGFSQTSPRSDIYAVGVLMNYMLTNKFPNEKLASGRYSYVIQKCVQIDENKRYDSAKQLELALDKKNFRYMISTLPGIRTGKKWLQIIATIYYAFMILWCFVLALCLLPKVEGTVMWMGFNLIGGLLPVFIIFDYQNWVSRLFPSANKIESIIIRAIATVVCISLALLLIILMPQY